MQSLFLEMRPDLAEVDETVVALNKAASGFLSDLKLASFEIALAEALTNAVRYGVSPVNDEPIRITMQMSEKSVTLEIVDAGEQGPSDLYDDVERPEDIDPLAESGRGLSLIRHCVDGLTFQPRQGENRLELIFHPDIAD